MSPAEQSDTSPTPAQSARRIRFHLGFLRYSVAYFLIALTLMFVAAPIVEQFEGGEIIESAMMTLVLLSAVLAVGGRRHTLIAAAVLVVPALIAKWSNHLRPDLVSAELSIALALLFAALVVWHLIRYILIAPQVNSEVLCAGIATYLMLGLIWSFAYALLYRLAPASFAFTVGPESSRHMQGFVALYFSILSLNSAGYGDIIPISGAARVLVMAQQTTGMFYVAILISRLVSLYSSPAPVERSDDAKQ